MPIYGYARVSRDHQELDIQLAELRAAGCGQIFCEKESALRDNRRELKRMLRRLRPGDVVIISALDRLTRAGVFKMLRVLDDIASRGATYRSLTEPWADPAHDFGEIMAAIVGYFAHRTWVDVIRRTTAGRERAKANGVKFGRKPKLSPEQRQEALARRAAGESQNVVALFFDVSCSTISRLERRNGNGRH
jgi:DNA invertase Pin-like site-specific DNA recombinase